MVSTFIWIGMLENYKRTAERTRSYGDVVRLEYPGRIKSAIKMY